MGGGKGRGERERGGGKGERGRGGGMGRRKGNVNMCAHGHHLIKI